MRDPHISATGLAQAETSKAFCVKNPNWMQDGVSTTHQGDLWIPKSVIMEDSLDTIAEAERNEEVEIFVAKWWLAEQ